MYFRTNQIGFLDSFVDQCLLICRPSYSHLFKNFCIHLGLPEHVLLSKLSRKCVGHAQWWVVPEEWLTGWARHRCEHSPLLSLQLLIPTNIQAQLSTTCTYKLDISTRFISLLHRIKYVYFISIIEKLTWFIKLSQCFTYLSLVLALLMDVKKKRENAHQNDQMYEDCWCNGCY